MKVLIVGQNPSKKNVDPNLPFIGTKSGKILEEWITFLNLTDYKVINCSNNVATIFDSASIKFFANNIDTTNILISYDKIISLGNIASKVLNVAGLPYFKLPHPSPKNRKLNDKKWLNDELKKAKEYLWEK